VAQDQWTVSKSWVMGIVGTLVTLGLVGVVTLANNSYQRTKTLATENSRLSIKHEAEIIELKSQQRAMWKALRGVQ